MHVIKNHNGTTLDNKHFRIEQQQTSLKKTMRERENIHDVNKSETERIRSSRLHVYESLNIGLEK